MSYVHNDIETLLNLYSVHCGEEQKLIASTLKNCANFKAGKGFIPWSANQKANILRQFNYTVDKQQALHDQITQFYLHQIAVTSNLPEKNMLVEAYIDIIKKMLLDASNCLKNLGKEIQLYQDTPPAEVLNAMFNRVVRRVENKLFWEFKRDFCIDNILN